MISCDPKWMDAYELRLFGRFEILVFIISQVFGALFTAYSC
jgi:hypothetical protein